MSEQRLGGINSRCGLQALFLRINTTTFEKFNFFAKTGLIVDFLNFKTTFLESILAWNTG